tara:strand:- start:127 stop:486 length:360 start_codon:yes stop_codon:yes gene_type:complete
MSEEGGQLQNYSVDQAAGAIVLVLGAVASLLLVIWQSKCHCKMNLCYLFQCERRPPSEEEMQGLKQQSEKLKAKAKKSKEDSSKKKKKKPDEDIEDGFASCDSEEEPEPEPEPLVPQAV